MQLFNGDCFEVMKSIPDKSVDLCVSDCPYKLGSKGGGIIKKRDYLDYLEELDCCNFEPLQFLEAIKPKMKKFYLYAFCNKTLIYDYIKFAMDNKYSFDVLCMAKTNPIPAYHNHHLSDLEYIILIKEKGTWFSNHKKMDDYRKFFITQCKRGFHPAEKPVELLERFVRVSCPENGVILDPFMGSGSTGVAAVKNHRDFIGIELDTKYFEIAKERINEAAMLNSIAYKSTVGIER